MSILDTFYILFESDASKLDKGIEQTEKKADGLLGKLKAVDKTGTEAGQGLFNLLKQGAGLLGLGLSFSALANGIKETAAEYDELSKLAARFRATTEAVDDFRDAAALLDITEERSTEALKNLDTAIQDTFLGLGRAKIVFAELGIQVVNAHGKLKPTTEVMGELAAKLQKMERGTQIRVMERLGLDPSLLKLFNSDLAGLQQRMEGIDRASGFNLEEAIKRANEYTKATKAMRLEVNVLHMFMDKLIETYKIAAMPWFTDSMNRSARWIKTFTDYLMQHRKVVEGFFVGVGAAVLYFLVPAAIKGAIAVWAMIAPFALIAAIVLGVAAAFALVYDDVMTFIEGGDSLTGRIVEWVKSIPLLTAALEFLGSLFRFVSKAITDFVGQGSILSPFFEVVTTSAKAFWEVLKGIWQILAFAGRGLQALGQLFDEKVGDGIKWTTEALIKGKAQLDAATTSPIASQTSASIAGAQTNHRSTTVQVDKIEVHTQATDAQGISRAVGGTMEAQLRQVTANYDDGVLG